MSRTGIHNRIARFLIPAALLALAGLAAFAQDPDRRISLDLKAAPLDSVLQTVMTQAGVSYMVGPDVDLTQNVTASFANTRFEDALRALLRSCDLTYSLDPGGIYVIRKKTDTRPVEREAPAEPNTTEPTGIVTDDGIRIEKITLRYTDPYEIWAVLTNNGQGNAFEIDGLTGLVPYGHDNSLLAKFGGTPFWGSGAGVLGGQPQAPGQGNGIQGGWPSGRWPGQGGPGQGGNGYRDPRPTPVNPPANGGAPARPGR